MSQKKCQRNVTSKALPKDVDWNAIGTYILSTALQFTLIVVTLKALDFLIPQIPWSGLDDLLPERDLPTKAKNAFTFLFFLFMSFRSRFFSPMDNRRPQVEEVRERKMPSWMPPPAAFPIIWGAIGLLRSASAFLIWKALGETYVVLPIVLFMLHLCVGDTWNTINNVEKRYGTAAFVVFFVLFSVLGVAYSYYQVSTRAAMLLAPTCVWITIATAAHLEDMETQWFRENDPKKGFKHMIIQVESPRLTCMRPA
eukprot:CAMPEP_0198234294 /NCGR_PEP_ID=MMETSP1446-20131203/345_1 /TAXON_ID=1461542 ORGANISM="Unidentified sp, Strain CCMP2111" /NCGR_SAMPLE_ID=MMETSP1446 /ASSEMBLY_ACC=CAM_ASM_001112 /LENGTH=253 /DNA_ID=CAMNT_0043915047 /DNA_START=292 /DNA_END=1052 /DNA_ORIENTATION=+